MKRVMVISWLVVLLFSCSAALAAPAKPGPKHLAAARQLTLAMGYDVQAKMTSQGICAMLVNSSKNYLLGLGDQERDQFAKALAGTVYDYIKEEYLTGVANLVAEKMSQAEIASASAFLAGGSGKALAKALPHLNLFGGQFARALVAARFNSSGTSLAIFNEALAKLPAGLRDKINRLRKPAKK